MPHQCTNCGKTFADGSKEMLSGCPECGGNKFQFRPPSASPTDADESATDSARGTGADSARGTGASDSTDAPDAADAGGTAGTGETADTRGTANTDETTDAGARTTAADAGLDTETDAEPDAESMSTSADSARSSADSTPLRGDAPAEGETPAESDCAADDDSAANAANDGPRTDEDADTEDAAQASARRDVVEPGELAGAVEREARDRPPRDTDGRVIEPESDDRPGLDELREELNDQFESIKIVSPGQYELNLMELYDRDEYIISLQEDGRYVIEVPETWRRNEDDED